MFSKYSTSGLLLYAVPLFASPLLAGWADAPWEIVPVFALLFAALVVQTRRMPEALGALAVTAATSFVVNIGVTSLLFGLGRALAILTPLNLPIWLPLAMGAVAAGIGIYRYRWTPEVAQMDALMDDMLAALEGTTSSQPQTPETVLHAIDALRGLPDPVTANQIAAIAEDLFMAHDADAFDLLFDHSFAEGDTLRDTERWPLLLLALLDTPHVRFIQSDLGGTAALAEQYLQSPHPRVRSGVANLLRTLLTEEEDTQAFPWPYDLHQAEAAFPRDYAGLADALDALCEKQALAAGEDTG